MADRAGEWKTSMNADVGEPLDERPAALQTGAVRQARGRGWPCLLSGVEPIVTRLAHRHAADLDSRIRLAHRADVVSRRLATPANRMVELAPLAAHRAVVVVVRPQFDNGCDVHDAHTYPRAKPTGSRIA
jgi:hypothetical protein